MGERFKESTSFHVNRKLESNKNIKMKRPDFIYKTSTEIGLILLTSGIWAGRIPQDTWKNYDFKPYKKGKYVTDVVQVTPDDGFYLHTFYDVCPWSYSGNFLAVTKFPYQGKNHNGGM